MRKTLRSVAVIFLLGLAMVVMLLVRTFGLGNWRMNHQQSSRIRAMHLWRSFITFLTKTLFPVLRRVPILRFSFELPGLNRAPYQLALGTSIPRTSREIKSAVGWKLFIARNIFTNLSTGVIEFTKSLILVSPILTLFGVVFIAMYGWYFGTVTEARWALILNQCLLLTLALVVLVGIGAAIYNLVRRLSEESTRERLKSVAAILPALCLVFVVCYWWIPANGSRIYKYSAASYSARALTPSKVTVGTSVINGNSYRHTNIEFEGLPKDLGIHAIGDRSESIAIGKPIEVNVLQYREEVLSLKLP